eukprot:231583_1
MACNVDFDRCASKYIKNVIYKDPHKNYRSISYFVLNFTVKRFSPNGLNLCFMDIQVYFDAIYGLYYLFIFVILEFYRIFWKLELNMKKRPHNHMVTVQIDETNSYLLNYNHNHSRPHTHSPMKHQYYQQSPAYSPVHMRPHSPVHQQPQPYTPSYSYQSSSPSPINNIHNNNNNTKMRKLKQSLTVHVQTRWYRAPEVILLEQTANNLGAVDIWSVGCIFAE